MAEHPLDRDKENKQQEIWRCCKFSSECSVHVSIPEHPPSVGSFWTDTDQVGSYRGLIQQPQRDIWAIQMTEEALQTEGGAPQLCWQLPSGVRKNMSPTVTTNGGHCNRPSFIDWSQSRKWGYLSGGSIVRKHLASSMWVLRNIPNSNWHCKICFSSVILSTVPIIKRVGGLGLLCPVTSSLPFGHGLRLYLCWGDNVLKDEVVRGHCW